MFVVIRPLVVRRAALARLQQTHETHFADAHLTLTLRRLVAFLSDARIAEHHVALAVGHDLFEYRLVIESVFRPRRHDAVARLVVAMRRGLRVRARSG